MSTKTERTMSYKWKQNWSKDQNHFAAMLLLLTFVSFHNNQNKRFLCFGIIAIEVTCICTVKMAQRVAKAHYGKRRKFRLKFT